MIELDYSLTRRFFIAGSSLTALMALAACRSELALEPIETGYAVDVTQSALPVVNAVRARKNLPALAYDEVAVNAAKDQALRMARVGKMSHDLGPDPSFLDRMKRLAVPLPAAENIAVGQPTTDQAVEAWIRSKKHLENMMGPFGGLGVALARQSSRNNRPYWAMILSNPDELANRPVRAA
jgi:uncharacterized protein YkwD